MVVSHDASASALGYLYQVDWALLEILRSGPDRPDQALMLEKLDDVSWQVGDDPEALLQLKDHGAGAPAIGDMSDDVWRTIGVWIDDAKFIDDEGPTFWLISTGRFQPGSALSLLRTDARDERSAKSQLDTAAEVSAAKATAKRRKQWLALSDAERVSLIGRITAVDAEVRITAISDEIRRVLYFIAPADDSRWQIFEERLFGWWHAVAVDMLSGFRGPITALQVRSFIERLRDEFSADNLPTSVVLGPEERAAAVSNHKDRVFVHQLGWVRVHPRQIELAILDFHRAVVQTTDWADRSLIEMSEFDSFKTNLADEWEQAYYAMLAEVPDDASEDVKSALGRELFNKLRDAVGPSIRRSYSEPFYRRGVQYELADEAACGWHPDFGELVKSLTTGHQ